MRARNEGAEMRERDNRYLALAFATMAILLLPTTATVGAESARESQEVDVVFVLDNSGSMRENDPDYLTRVAVSDFSAALADDPAIDARIGIVLFDGKAHLVHPLSEIETNGGDLALREPLLKLDFSGQRTNSPAGIERALYEIRKNGRQGARQAIVLLSDGMIDTGEHRSNLEAARWLREDLANESATSDIRIFGIAFTEEADYQLMQAVARRTSAQYYRALEAYELTEIVDDVLTRISEEVDPDEALAGAPETVPAPHSTEAPPPSSPVSNSTATPDVAAALPTRDDGLSSALIGFIPLAILLVAGSLYWRHRSAEPLPAPALVHAVPDSDAPPAQLLDLDGHLGPVGAPIAIEGTRMRIGRDAHNDIILADDTISSEHAILEVESGRYWLEDRRSTNGTRVGDQRLAPDQRIQLKGGDHLRFGEIDLMFVLEGYVSVGGTVYLGSATVPPPSWNGIDAANGGEGVEAPPQADVREVNESSSPSNPVSLIRESQPKAPALVAKPEAYQRSLDYHLELVSEISSSFESFINRVFGEEIRGALSVAAYELTMQAREVGQIVHKTYTFDRVRFVICGVPGAKDDARDGFVESYGGFTRLLTEQLRAYSFSADRCETLAVLTCGLEGAPWVSLSVIPDEGQDPHVDLLSYEFLTDRERAEIAHGEHTEFSRSGLG
jgi:Mg-chelatase subunit ChlD